MLTFFHSSVKQDKLKASQHSRNCIAARFTLHTPLIHTSSSQAHWKVLVSGKSYRSPEGKMESKDVCSFYRLLNLLSLKKGGFFNLGK